MIKLRDILTEVYDVNLLEISTNEFRIFCDLDGVLVDLDSGIRKLTGGFGFEEYVNRNSHDKMWELINQQGSVWWATLPWKLDGKQLWDTIKALDVTILTAGSKRNSGDIAVIGKKQWCADNLGTKIQVIVTDRSRDKHQYAQPKYILIDDLLPNINDWKAKGGIGILHKNTTQTIQELNQILNK